MTDGTPKVKNRLFTILVLLPAITAVLVASGFYQQLLFQLQQEQSNYGYSTARLMASQLAQAVVADDVVSLNVLVTRLTNEEPIDFVSVYDDNNRLLVQSGRQRSGARSYSSEITFQDSLVGFVNVSVAHTSFNAMYVIVALFGLAVAYIVVVWRLLPGVLIWLNGESPVEAEEQYSNVLPQAPVAEGSLQQCILVVRIRPARHLARHFDRFYQAAKLYGGVVEQTTNEELVIHFDGPDALFMATCAGLLIRQIATRLSMHIKFGGTLDLLGDEPEKIRKSSSYLASISEGDLLVAGGEELIADRAELQTFHHSLVDAEDLVKITGLRNQELLNAQADQLAAG